MTPTGKETREGKNAETAFFWERDVSRVRSPLPCRDTRGDILKATNKAKDANKTEARLEGAFLAFI